MTAPLMTDRTSRRRRAVLTTIAVGLIVATVGVVWAWRRDAKEPDRRAGAMPMPSAQMPGMDDMAGMPMGESSVRLTSDQLRQFGVTFGSVERRMLESTVRAVGTVTVDESRITQVTPRFGGFVERLHVDKTGQPVQRGQPLMDVYSPELLAAQQELLVAADLQKSIGQSAVPGVPGSSTDLVAAAKRRLQLWDISDAQIDEIVRSGQARRALTLYARASGVVLEKNVVRGQAIEPGQMLYMIANLSVVWIDVALRDADISSVRVGSTADAQLEVLPGRPFKGRVTFVYPMLDSVSRTVRARVEVANTNGLLKPGMYATVTLASSARTALTVPTSALVRTGDRTIVFVDMGPSADSRQLMPNEIEIGRTAGEYTEVLAGLEPGQRVVTSAQFLLDSESNLAQVMKSMIGQVGVQDMGNMKEMRDMPGMEMPSSRKRR